MGVAVTLFPVYTFMLWKGPRYLYLDKVRQGKGILTRMIASTIAVKSDILS